MMNDKRRFLLTSSLASLASLSLPAASALAATTTREPALLTVSGAIDKANRGPFDPVLDQLMSKHGIRFEHAHQFDAAALERLPSVTIRPTLEYDAKRHTLQGPLLATVLEAAGAAAGSGAQLGLRALDGYNAVVGAAEALAWRMVVATQIDGEPMALGGLGPQWALYDADNVAAFKDKPLKERFALCPWGLYHIAVMR